MSALGRLLGVERTSFRRAEIAAVDRCRHRPTHFAVMHNEVFAPLMW
jgi:hypothetical protein